MRKNRSGTRSVDIDGDATGAIIITGDQSPVTVHRGGRQVFALSPLARKPAVPADSGPAALLMARYELVDFVGRTDLCTEARSWLASERRRAARLVTGPGGQGKSRLALQVAREAAAAAGWQVLVARHILDGGLLAVDGAPDPVPVPDRPAGVLVLVDYADRWPPEDLLQLLTRPEAAQGRVRMLLLGRSGAFWSPFTRPLTEAGIGVSQRHLQPLDQRGTRAAQCSTPRRAAWRATWACGSAPDLTSRIWATRASGCRWPSRSPP